MTLEKTISDMETNGVYFEEPPIPLEEEEKETICHYSGLPSVESYMAEQEELEIETDDDVRSAVAILNLNIYI